MKNSSLDIKQEYFDKMRYYFRQFGLGVQTGIDLPNETAGQIGRKDNQPGFLLDYSIGQYDTYTPHSACTIYFDYRKWRVSNETTNCSRD